MNIPNLKSIYPSIKEVSLFGRYITNIHIEQYLKKINKSSVETIGCSVENRPIYALRFGTGPIRILMWSQMHGNESTTTKALFDFFNFLETTNPLSQLILERCNIMVIPILNPDGAKRYTRANANNVDLNRDAQDLSQPESKILSATFNDFKPNYGFNLHGQRTIFGAGAAGKSATLSFLAPSQDKEGSLTENRKIAMTIIAKTSEALQEEIPNGIGRYDDGFNINCVGDTFQSLGTPIILFEAGHFQDDYDREQVRFWVFLSILKSLEIICSGVESAYFETYFKIPENKICFYDILIRNAKIDDKDNTDLVTIGIQYKEVLKDDKVVFIPKVEMIASENDFFGHKEIDACGFKVKNQKKMTLEVGGENDFVFVNYEKTLLKLK